MLVLSLSFSGLPGGAQHSMRLAAAGGDVWQPKAKEKKGGHKRGGDHPQRQSTADRVELEPRGGNTGDSRNEIGIARLILGVGRQLKLLHPSETIPDEAAPRRLVKPPPKKSTSVLPQHVVRRCVDAACARDGPTAGSRATDPPSTHLRVKHSDLGTALYHAPHHGAATRIVEAPDILLLDHSERDKRGRTHRGGGGIGTAVPRCAAAAAALTPFELGSGGPTYKQAKGLVAAASREGTPVQKGWAALPAAAAARWLYNSFFAAPTTKGATTADDGGSRCAMDISRHSATAADEGNQQQQATTSKPGRKTAPTREQAQLGKLKEANAKYKNLLKLAKERIQEQ
ncbi:hypothetical protein THAOC_13992, partial [Thalassiosira oceanica]